MKAAAAKGIRTITSHDLAASVTAGVAIPAKTMVLTFDDGRVEMLTYAWPIMQKYGTSRYLPDGRGWLARDMNADGVAVEKGYIGSFFVIFGRSGDKYLTFDQEAKIARGGNEFRVIRLVSVAAYHGAALLKQTITAGHRLEDELRFCAVVTGMVTTKGARKPIVRGVPANRPVPVMMFVYPYGLTSNEAVNLPGEQVPDGLHDRRGRQLRTAGSTCLGRGTSCNRAGRHGGSFPQGDGLLSHATSRPRPSSSCGSPTG